METNLPNPPKSKRTRYLRLLFVIIGSIALCATAYQIVMNTAFHGNLYATSTVDHIVLPIVHIIAAVFFLALVIRALRIMKWFDRFWLSLYTWQGMRRLLIALAVLATLLAAFYAEENWRGKRAWEQCKAELEAKGEKLDWSDYRPAPIPDDQNVFKAPKMAEWFVRKSWSVHGEGNRSNELNGILNSKPVVEFIQKRRSNVVAKVTITTSNDALSVARADVLLRYSQHALYLATTNDFSKSAEEVIPLIQLEAMPISLAISNFASRANLKFELDPAILAQWKSAEPNISLKMENVSARSVFFALLSSYNFAWVEDPKTGIGRITPVPDPGPTDSKPRVLVQVDVSEKLKALIKASFARGPEVKPSSPLSEVRLFKFITNAVPSIEAVRVVVISDEQLNQKEVKDFFPRDLPRAALRDGTGWRVEATSSNTFDVYLANETYLSAADYLAWSDQFAPQFEIIREALKRPQAQIEGNFDAPYLMPIPDFVGVRNIAQMLAERAQCYLLLRQPDKALRELTTIRDMHRLMDGKPLTLVSAMINVAITGLYTAIIVDGFRLNAWGDAELVALQKQLAEIELSPNVALSLRAERAATSHSFLTMNARQMTELFRFQESDRGFWRRMTDPVYLLLKFLPRGWIYQNLVIGARLEQSAFLDAYDPATQIYTPAKAGNGDMIDKAFRPWTPFNALARIAVPNFIRALQVTARNQTLVNQTLIACGLERYHRAHGSYPETLDALVPQFIAKVPHDIIGGQPLKYHRTDDGKFLLYSVGWNATDDGGKATQDKGGLADVKSPDWTWQATLP